MSVSHTYPDRTAGVRPMKCRTCGDAIPAGKLGCERCLLALSEAASLDFQRQFMPRVVANQLELTMTYTPGRDRCWHVQRYADPLHAFCGTDLAKKTGRDPIYYRDYFTTKLQCRRCTEILEKLVAEIPPDQLIEQQALEPPTPIDGVFDACSD